MLSAKRRTKTKTIIKRRVKQRESLGCETEVPGHYAKRNAFDCGRSACKVCNPEKLEKNRAAKKYDTINEERGIK